MVSGKKKPFLKTFEPQIIYFMPITIGIFNTEIVNIFFREREFSDKNRCTNNIV